jgi:uncharacterized membrane protein
MSDHVSTIVTENIDKIIRTEEIERPSPLDLVSDAIGEFCGTIYFIGTHIAIFGIWIAIGHWFLIDPFPYPLYATITSLEAVIMAGFVLRKQNRMGLLADRRAHLDLQVNLLAEREVTHIIQILHRLNAHFGIVPKDEPDQAFAQPIPIDHLVETLVNRLPE